MKGKDIEKILGEDRVPDPGEEYWENYEKKVQDKISSQNRFSRIAPYAAALFLVLLGCGFLVLQTYNPSPGVDFYEKRITQIGSSMDYEQFREVTESVVWEYDTFPSLISSDFSVRNTPLRMQIEMLSDREVDSLLHSLKKELKLKSSKKEKNDEEISRIIVDYRSDFHC